MGGEQSKAAAQSGNKVVRPTQPTETPYGRALRAGDKKGALETQINAGVLPTQRDLEDVYDSGVQGYAYGMSDIACAYILNQSQLIKRVSAAIPHSSIKSKTKEIVFIAFTETGDKLNINLPYTIVFRKIDDYSPEGAFIIRSKDSLRKPITKEESTRITEVLRKHSGVLMSRHSNIQVMSACSVKSKSFGTFNEKIIPTTCIVIYVDVKGLIPLREQPLPEFLDTIPVDVREGGPIILSNKAPNEFQTNLRMGCQIASELELGWGTLGAFVEEPDSNQLYCLTCAHVVLKPEEFTQSKDGNVSFLPNARPIFQPSPDPLNHIGSIKRAVFSSGKGGHTGVDVALISVTEPRAPLTGEFPAGDFSSAGFDAVRPMVYTTGEVYTQETMPDPFENRWELIKFGAASGPTRGSLLINGTSLQKRTHDGAHREFGFQLFNQIEVMSLDPTITRAFAERGDSGSLVFFPHNGNCSDLRALGILEGGTSYNTYIITPIWDVLAALKLPPKLKVFPFHDAQLTSLASSVEGMNLQSTSSSVQLTAQHTTQQTAQQISQQTHQSTQQTSQQTQQITQQTAQQIQQATQQTIAALKRELLEDADRRDQAKSQEMTAQISASHTQLNAKIEDLYPNIVATHTHLNAEVAGLRGQIDTTRAYLNGEVDELGQKLDQQSQKMDQQHQELMSLVYTLLDNNGRN